MIEGGQPKKHKQQNNKGGKRNLGSRLSRLLSSRVLPSSMAFWGKLVKQEEPVSVRLADHPHKRLRISQATLANANCYMNGFFKGRSMLFTKVGENREVCVCSLRMHEQENWKLDLEFEEPDDVIFSVKGPRPIYISGYFFNEVVATSNDKAITKGEASSPRLVRTDDCQIRAMDTSALPVQLVDAEKVNEVETAETQQLVERKSDPSGSSSSAGRGNVNIVQQPCLEHASNSMQESTYSEEIAMDTPALPVQLVAGEKVKEVETAETEQQVERKSDPSGSSSSAERGNVNIGQQPCLEHASNSMQESTYLEEIGRVSTLDGVNKETDLAVNDACAPSVGVAVASQAIGVGAFKQPSMSTCHNQNEVDHHEEIIFNSNAEAMQILDETRSIRNDETQNAVCAAESEENPKVGDGEPDVDLNSVRKKLDFDVVADQKFKPRKENEIDLEREILIPSEPVKDVSNNVYEGNGEALCSVLPETIGVGDMPYWMEIPHAYVLEHMNDIEGMNDNTDLGRIERGDGEPDVDLNSVRRKLNFGVVADQKKQPHKENENDVEREILIPSEPVKAVSDNVHEGIEEALCSVLPENIGAHDMPYGMDVPEGRVLDHMNDIGGLKDDRNLGGIERKRRKRKRKDMKLVDDKIDAMVEELMNPVSPSKMAIQTAPNETEITDIRENTKGEDPLDPNCMMPIIDLPLMHKEKLKPKKMKRKKKRNKEKLLSADHLKAISEDVQLNGNTQPGNDVHGGGSVNLNNIEASVEFQYGDGHKLKRRRKRRRGKKTSVYGEKSLEQNYMGNFDLPLLEEQNSKPKKKKFEKSMCADRLNAGEIVHRESISRDCSEANQPSRIAQAGNGVDEEGSLEPNDTMGFLGFHVWYNQKEKPKKTRKRKKEKSKCADHLKGGVNETQLGEDGREADHAAGGDGEPLKHEDVQRFEDRNEHPYAMACPSNVDDSGLIKKVKKLKRTKKVTGRDGVDIKDETLRHAIECDEQATTQYIFTGVDDNVSADLCQKSKHEFIKDGSPQIPVPGSKKTKTLKKRKKAGRVDDVEDQKIRNHAGIPLSEHQVGLAMTVEIAPGAIVLALPAFVKC